MFDLIPPKKKEHTSPQRNRTQEKSTSQRTTKKKRRQTNIQSNEQYSQKMQKTMDIEKLRTGSEEFLATKFPKIDSLQLTKGSFKVENHSEGNSSPQQMEVDTEMSVSKESTSSTQQTEGNTKIGNNKKGSSVVSYIEYDEEDFEEGNKNNVSIKDIIIGGRTPSPFTGTMGAHSTAWIAHIDAVRRQLIGYHLDQAIDYLINFAITGLNSPLFSLKDSLKPEHQKKLDEAKGTLNETIKSITTFTKSDKINNENRHIIEQQLRNLIKYYLTFTNYLPLSTVEGGDTGGHAEGGARKFLNLFEYGNSRNDLINDPNYSELKADFEKEQKGITKEIKIDFKNLEDNSDIEAKVIGKLWDLFAIETPGVFTKLRIGNKDSLYQVWALALNNFLTTIRMAYPYAYEFVKMHDTKIFKDSLISKLKTQEGTFKLSEEYKITESDVDNIIKYLSDDLDNSFEEAQPATFAVGPSDGETKKSRFICYFLLDGDTIGDVVIQGRTTNPFNSAGAGAHSTAWVALTDAVRRDLINKTLDEAFEKMKELEKIARESPTASNEWLKLAYPSQRHLFEEAKGNLDSLKNGNFTEKDNSTKRLLLGNFVKHYFELVNSTPLTTVAIADTSGDAEGYYRQILINFEYNGDSSIPEGEREQKKSILQDALFRLFDPKAIDQFTPDIDYKGSLNEDSNELHIKKWAYSLHTFLNILELAYPRSFKEADFKNYLIDEIIKPSQTEIDQPMEIDSKEKTSSGKAEKVKLEELLHKKKIVDLLERRGNNFKSLASTSQEGSRKRGRDQSFDEFSRDDKESKIQKTFH